MQSKKFVLDTSQSIAARLRPIAIDTVKITDNFWQPRLERNQTNSIPRLFELFESKGVLNNFRRLYGGFDGTRRGFLYTDSDLYKWMESAAFVLQSNDDSHVRSLLNQAIETIIPAQQADGYLNTWFVDDRANERWNSLDTSHELYCAGHLIQAALAHQKATNEPRLLDCAIRFADLIDTIFRVENRPGSPGHPEIEMALIELYRATQNKRYLKLAGHFLDRRDVTSRNEISGHAVRACYFMAGATDYFLETGNPTYLETIQRQWHSMVTRKIYITGGVGGRYEGESFGNAYELPNERAYAETCAAIATIFWNWRMLQINGNAQYTDWLERTLYNGFLSGVSLGGTEYFYMNPLACSGKGEDDPWYGWARRQPYQREQWFDCTCCPPNIQRLIASLPSYLYSSSSEGFWIHLFVASRFDGEIGEGVRLVLIQETAYPWNGHIRFRLFPEKECIFTLFIRIPNWARRVVASVGEIQITKANPGEYLAIKRSWHSGSLVELTLDMPVELMQSDFVIAPNRGSVAVQRGPLVYCLEGVDHNDRDIRDLRIVEDTEFDVQDEKNLLGGLTTITAQGHESEKTDSHPLYFPFDKEKRIQTHPLPLKFVPYFAWANRGATSMAVWVPFERDSNR